MRKKLQILILTLALSALISPAFANSDKVAKREITTEEQAELNHIKNRITAIKAIDKSTLSKVERKALKKEVKEMKKRADFLNQNVSLSLGAIIIILLLLIIIL